MVFCLLSSKRALKTKGMGCTKMTFGCRAFLFKNGR